MQLGLGSWEEEAFIFSFLYDLQMSSELYSNVNVDPIISIRGVFLNYASSEMISRKATFLELFFQIKFAKTCSKLILFTILGDEMK